MKDHKVLLELISAEDKALKGIQQKINQWMTIGLLVKFETQSIGDQILFKIILKKEAE